VLESPRDLKFASIVLPYVVYACSVVLILLSIFVGLDISVSIAWSDVAPSVEMVNRTRKGDRLPPPTFQGNAMNQSGDIEVLQKLPHKLELLDGCESLASSLTRSPLARIAGRCLS
jgi:hypothetical protein